MHPRRSEAGVRFWADQDRRRRGRLQKAHVRRARVLGALGLLAACALPPLLWWQVVVDIASQFRLDLSYLLAGWSPWVLILGGIAFLIPVALSAGGDPDSRWYPRARNAYAGWAVTLYLLGCALATQVAQIHDHLQH